MTESESESESETRADGTADTGKDNDAHCCGFPGCACCCCVSAGAHFASSVLFSASPGYILLRRVAEARVPPGFPEWMGPTGPGGDHDRSAMSLAMERAFGEFIALTENGTLADDTTSGDDGVILSGCPALRALALALDMDEATMRRHLGTLAAIISHRRGRARETGTAEPSNLSAANAGVWGSARQYRFGVALSLVLRDAELREAAGAPGGAVHPSLAPFLAPCGGIVGAGNDSLYEGAVDSPVVLHACVHDACGYALASHGVGPGYNYLGTTLTLSPTTSPLSCQAMGLLAARSCLWQLARERGSS